jgi:hypothetical protein
MHGDVGTRTVDPTSQTQDTPHPGRRVDRQHLRTGSGSANGGRAHPRAEVDDQFAGNRRHQIDHGITDR